MKRLVFVLFVSILLAGLISASVIASNESSNATDDENDDKNNTQIGDDKNGTTFGDSENETDVNEDNLTGRNRTLAQELKEKLEALKEQINEIKEKAKEIKEYAREHGGWINVSGKNITVRELSDDKKELIADKINAKTGLNLTAEDIDNKTTLRAYLSNGRWALIKYMPNVASAKALSVLRAKCGERNCSIELKEVGTGNKTRLAYEVQTEKESRIFFLFKKKMPVQAQIDAETGQIIAIKKPWWSFVAKEDNSVNADETADANETVSG